MKRSELKEIVRVLVCAGEKSLAHKVTSASKRFGRLNWKTNTPEKEEFASAVEDYKLYSPDRHSAFFQKRINILKKLFDRLPDKKVEKVFIKTFNDYVTSDIEDMKYRIEELEGSLL